MAVAGEDSFGCAAIPSVRAPLGVFERGDAEASSGLLDGFSDGLHVASLDDGLLLSARVVGAQSGKKRRGAREDALAATK